MSSWRAGVRAGLADARVCLGTMYFGTAVPEATARGLLDRYLERGGRLIDTANCYAFWAEGGSGEESERLLGRWLADRGARDEVLLASKVGSRPEPAGAAWPECAEGLGAAVIGEQFRRSTERLGTERIDLYFAHIEDPDTELTETLGAFDALVRAGSVGVLGASNIGSDRLRAARESARERGYAPYEVVQSRHSYLVPDPGADIAPQRAFDPALLAYAAREGLRLQGYSPLLGGAYTRPGRAFAPEYGTPENKRRLQVLDALGRESGLTRHQLVLAWMAGGEPPVVPVLGVSSIAQLDEAMDALAGGIPQEVRARLDEAWPGGEFDR